MTTPSRVSWLFAATTASTLLAVVLIVGAAITMNDGHLVYLTDDPGIHLSVVNNLVNHGTWGVVPGQFESASSSPGWTLLLSAPTAVISPLANVLPLIANVIAGVWLIWIFTTNQRLVGRDDHSWSALAIAIVLGIVVLYIPTLALLGMEHTLQCALVLYAFVRFERLLTTSLTVRALAPLLAVTFLAGTVRFETVFFAVGCGVAFLIGTVAHIADVDTRARWTRATALRAAALVSLAGAAPIVVLGLVNRSFGHGFLPNSVVAKSALGERGGLRDLVKNPYDLVSALQRDPVVFACTLLATIALIWAWCGGPRRNTPLATAFVVTALLHANFADFGWFERYQAYLVVLGVYLAFQILADVVPSYLRTAAKVSLVLAIVVLSTLRIDLTVSAARGSSNTYRQRYQLGKFFEREYADQPIATSELGYPSLFHDGPIVDVLGLGSHEVLDVIEGPGMTKERLADLLEAENVRVLGILPEYPYRPSGWVRVGVWILDERVVAGPGGKVVEFWAPRGARAAELREKLERFQPELPSRVVLAFPESEGEDEERLPAL